MRQTAFSKLAPLPYLLAVVVPCTVSACDGSQTVVEERQAPVTLAAAERAGAVDRVAIDGTADRTLHLITRVETETGSIVEFYEPEPGVVLMSEFGGRGTRPFPGTLREHTASEVYKIVAPASPVPAALLAAEARERATAAPATAAAPTNEGASSGRAEHAPRRQIVPMAVDPNAFCGRTWFVDNVQGAAGDCAGNNGHKWFWCWFDTGPGAWVRSHNIWVDEGEICVADGSNVAVNVSRSNGESGGGYWSMPPQSWRWWWHGGGTNFWGNPSNYDLSIDVTGDWGDIQFAGSTYWR